MNTLSSQTEAGFQLATALPWLVIVAVIAPFAFAAWRTKIFPTRRWVFFLVVSLVASVANVFRPGLLPVVLAVDALALVVGGIDFLILWATTNTGIQVDRSHPRTCSIGVPLECEVTVRNRTSSTLSGKVRDDSPETFQMVPDSHELNLPSGSEVTFGHTLTPIRRGAFTLFMVHLCLRSPLRFWNRYRTIECESRVNVYPDMKQMADYAILARTNRLSLIGVRRTRRIGQDSDFERLRDYSRDDNYRHIDWRSTARRRKLTVKQFQTDQSQRVIFMLDCGRMMTNLSGGLSLLDHALNASLMMAYVALHQGDSVGMLCFSDKVHAYIPPRGGSSQMNRLLQAGFDQFPRMVESRYDQAFVYLQNHCKQRSLVTLTTNIIDDVNAAAVVDYLGNLSGQHLPVGVMLRDRTMFDAADEVADLPRAPLGAVAVADDRQLYRAAAAADILIWRKTVLRDLEHRGVLCVDAYPDELTAPLVNQYLEVKAKHLL